MNKVTANSKSTRTETPFAEEEALEAASQQAREREKTHKVLPDFCTPRDWRPIAVELYVLEALVENAWNAVAAGTLKDRDLLADVFRIEGALHWERTRLWNEARAHGWDGSEVYEENPGGIRLHSGPNGEAHKGRQIALTLCDPDRDGLADFQNIDRDRYLESIESQRRTKKASAARRRQKNGVEGGPVDGQMHAPGPASNGAKVTSAPVGGVQ